MYNNFHDNINSHPSRIASVPPLAAPFHPLLACHAAAEGLVLATVLRDQGRWPPIGKRACHMCTCGGPSYEWEAQAHLPSWLVIPLNVHPIHLEHGMSSLKKYAWQQHWWVHSMVQWLTLPRSEFYCLCLTHPRPRLASLRWLLRDWRAAKNNAQTNTHTLLWSHKNCQQCMPPNDRPSRLIMGGSLPGTHTHTHTYEYKHTHTDTHTDTSNKHECSCADNKGRTKANKANQALCSLDTSPLTKQEEGPKCCWHHVLCKHLFSAAAGLQCLGCRPGTRHLCEEWRLLLCLMEGRKLRASTCM